jgi:uncharacterized protein (TIGR04255 family)
MGIYWAPMGGQAEQSPASTRAARPRHRYGASALRLVLCQLQFPVLHRFDEPAVQAQIQDALRGSYPREQQQQQVAITIGPNGPVPGPGATVWRHQTLAGDWTVVAQSNSIALETTSYRQYEDFIARFGLALELVELLGVSVVERIGLRYINQFRHFDVQRPQDWAGLLRPELLGIIGGGELEGDVVQAIQDVRLSEPDGTFVIRHGYIGVASGVNEPHYLLDLDCFDDQARALDRDELLSRLGRFHDRISDVFEMSLTDAMREHLQDQGEIDDAIPDFD